MPIHAYAFDAYGTLFDVHAAIGRHKPALGEDADAFSALWRAKQLEYSWVRTLMGCYADFWQLTQEALDFALARFPAVPRALRQPLLDAYWTLEAYPDAAPALQALKMRGSRTAIFTNGTQAMAEAAASASGLTPLLDAVVSVEAIRAFKTSPAAYAHLCGELQLAPAEVCLVSSNRWDIAGASAYGLRTIWVNRTGQPDEYFDAQPDRDVKDLSEIL